MIAISLPTFFHVKQGIMDSGEGRARWLHYTTNSYIVQEDYKVGSRPSSQPPSSSKSQSEESPGDGVKLYDVSSDTKWWLHQQPKDNPTSFFEPSWETMEMEEKYAKIKEFEAVFGEKKTGDELSKAELLEALCHSQTRAREAEKAAQQANNEKEDMITHFMKQASQLFAYKQWLRILQLEAIRNSSKYQQRVGNRKKKKPGSSRYKKGESFGSFLLGLSLGGAGLLLGWTLGWLFR